MCCFWLAVREFYGGVAREGGIKEREENRILFPCFNSSLGKCLLNNFLCLVREWEGNEVIIEFLVYPLGIVS